MANTTELADLEKGKDSVSDCGCGHELCATNKATGSTGTTDRGMS